MQVRGSQDCARKFGHEHHRVTSCSGTFTDVIGKNKYIVYDFPRGPQLRTLVPQHISLMLSEDDDMTRKESKSWTGAPVILDHVADGLRCRRKLSES